MSDLPEPDRQSLLRRLVPLGVLVLGAALFFALGLHHYLTLESLRANRTWLLSYVDAYPVAAALLYFLAFTAVVAFAIPGGTILAVAGGFLLGTVEAAILAVSAATIGGTILFLATRTAFADYFRARMGPGLIRFEDGFNRNAFSYLLSMRLIPMFPFPIPTIAAGLLGVKARVFVAATLFGIAPATAVFASLGNGLGALFDQGLEPDLFLILEPRFLFPLLGLACLALIQPVWRALSAWRAR